MSPYTNYILVHERGELAACDLPELRQVPGMLAAGWGGTGSVSLPKPKRAAAPSGVFPVTMAACAAPMDMMAEAPMKAARENSVSSPSVGGMSVRDARRIQQQRARASEFMGLDALAALGVPRGVIEGLEALVALGYDEQGVVLAFLAAVLKGTTPLKVDRTQRRQWLVAIKQDAVPAGLLQTVAESLRSCTGTAWAWSARGLPATASG